MEQNKLLHFGKMINRYDLVFCAMDFIVCLSLIIHHCSYFQKGALLMLLLLLQ